MHIQVNHLINFKAYKMTNLGPKLFSM